MGVNTPYNFLNSSALIELVLPTYIVGDASIKLTGSDIPPRLGREALLALVNWLARRNEHDPTYPACGVDAGARGAPASTRQPAGPDGLSLSDRSSESGGQQR